MKHKALIILELLLEGHRVKIQDYTYALSEEGKIGFLATSETAGKPETWQQVVLHTDMSLNSFIKLCESVSDEEVVFKTSNALITEINQAGGLSIWTMKQNRKTP